jgi:hypothetical protein
LLSLSREPARFAGLAGLAEEGAMICGLVLSVEELSLLVVALPESSSAAATDVLAARTKMLARKRLVRVALIRRPLEATVALDCRRSLRPGRV